jgi:hypothetical protein
MRTRKDSQRSHDIEQALPMEDCLVWESPQANTKPEDEAKKDFAESLEKQRRALQELVEKVLRKAG